MEDFHLYTVEEIQLRYRHAATAKAQLVELSNLELDLDQAAKELWQLTDPELQSIRAALSDFGFAGGIVASEESGDEEDGDIEV